MLDLIRKTMLTGVGLAAMTKDKVEALAKELPEKGKLSEKEGKDLFRELLKKSEQARKDLETKVEGMVHKVLGKWIWPPKKILPDWKKRSKISKKRQPQAIRQIPPNDPMPNIFEVLMTSINII